MWVCVAYKNRNNPTIDYIKQLCDKYINSNEFVFKPHILYMPDSGIVADINEMMQLFRWASETMEISEKGIFIIDEKASDNMKCEIEIGKLINEAIENDRVEVFYQPIYSTEKGHFTSAEALVRIRDGEGKLIPPNLFIGIAEKNGSILKLGEIVFEKVCSFLETSEAVKLGIEYIEVNLSVVQCEYEGLSKRFIEIMNEHNIPGNMINLEITESATMTSKNRLIRNIADLKNFGVGFSLDDFGTGQSNLNYIVEMPVDIVKFDRGMINAYFESHKAKYVMDAAMHMIQGLKLDIVSEGIETEEQLSIMKNLGIQYIQGFYFSRPLPEAECLEFLRKRNNLGIIAMQS
jgi:EAL domain-containing protein (putative c-di-GMP-specific phosphodiesterase class I)